MEAFFLYLIFVYNIRNELFTIIAVYQRRKKIKLRDQVQTKKKERKKQMISY